MHVYRCRPLQTGLASEPDMRLLGLLLSVGLAFSASPSRGADSRLVEFQDGTQIPVTVYPGNSSALALWLPSEHGTLPAHHGLARALSDHGIESWVSDPFAAYFLPVGATSLNEIPTQSITDLISAAGRTGKVVYLVTHDKGTAMTLRAARQWQIDDAGPNPMGGVILISPYLLEGTPEVGQEAHYRPIAGATNLPVFVMQPVQSPLYWRLPKLVGELERGGSSVFVQSLREVRDRFFFRPDALPAEEELTRRLPDLLANAAHLLATQERSRSPAPLSEEAPVAEKERSERALVQYSGDPLPPPLRLRDLAGKPHDLADYEGEVVLLNFWASWCPPCVHEMPSMQALLNRFKERPFEILAVNLGEQPEPVQEFLKTQGLELKVLMDPGGTAIRDWKVFAFPTSYLIDKHGRIRYALYGAIDWLDPEAITIVESLVKEPAEVR